MSAPAKSKLDSLLAGVAAGTWVVLNPSMSKILGKAPTAEEAMRKADIPAGMSGRAGHKRPVIFQIPDPATAYYF